MIRIALPNKGRLREEALDLLARAGLELDSRGDRALIASLGGEFTALFVRTQDIPEFVADGAADVGITGRDLVVESGRDLAELLDLGFGRCRLAVAARDDDGYDDLDRLPKSARVATSFPRIAGQFFSERGQDVTLVPVSGAAEIAPHLGVADVIVDLVSTGSTLKMNGLREVETILVSTARLITRPELLDDETSGRTLRELVAALESVIRAVGKRYLMANVRRDSLEQVKRILPGISGPTIIDVMDHGEYVAAHAVVDQKEVYRAIAQLKEIGATGILVTTIERLMP